MVTVVIHQGKESTEKNEKGSLLGAVFVIDAVLMLWQMWGNSSPEAV